jgi:hypothetical protein
MLPRMGARAMPLLLLLLTSGCGAPVTTVYQTSVTPADGYRCVAQTLTSLGYRVSGDGMAAIVTAHRHIMTNDMGTAWGVVRVMVDGSAMQITTAQFNPLLGWVKPQNPEKRAADVVRQRCTR